MLAALRLQALLPRLSTLPAPPPPPRSRSHRMASTSTPAAPAAPDLVIVNVTVPSIDVGRAIADALVGERLAACVSIVPGVESVYRWEGRVQRDQELLLLVKTRAALVGAAAARVRALHPYEECEVLAVPVAGGSGSYMAWVADSTAGAEGGGSAGV